MKIVIFAFVLTMQIASIICPHQSPGKKPLHPYPSQLNTDSVNPNHPARVADSFQQPRLVSFYDNVPVENPSARMRSRGQAGAHDVPPRHSNLPHSNFPTSNSRAILEEQNESEGKLRQKKVDQDVKGKAVNRQYGFGRDADVDRACMDFCRRMENEARINDKKQIPIDRSEASAGQPTHMRRLVANRLRFTINSEKWKEICNQVGPKLNEAKMTEKSQHSALGQLKHELDDLIGKPGPGRETLSVGKHAHSRQRQPQSRIPYQYKPNARDEQPHTSAEANWRILSDENPVTKCFFPEELESDITSRTDKKNTFSRGDLHAPDSELSSPHNPEEGMPIENWDAPQTKNQRRSKMPDKVTPKIQEALRTMDEIAQMIGNQEPDDQQNQQRRR